MSATITTPARGHTTTIYAIRKTHRAQKRTTRIPWMRYVWKGKLKATPGGLYKSDLKLNAQGKVVSKRASRRGQKLHARLKREGRLAPPFTSASAKLANARSLTKRKRTIYSSSTTTNVPYEDYYNVNVFK